MSGAVVETPEAAAARFLNSLLKPSRIMVAISGGGDSVGLLVALADAIHARGDVHRLSATTIDHGLRAESADEARDVAALCARFEIPHSIGRWEGEKPSTGLMAAAREARYELLAAAAAADGADVIVTGHTFDDQQETLAMRATRLAAEAGPSGRGIADAVLFDRRCWVVRPFLDCRRKSIRDFLVARGVGWIDDPSNDNMKYERVRVRAKLRDAEEAPPPGGAGASLSISTRAAAWFIAHARVHAGLICEIDRQAFSVEPELYGYGLGHLAAVIGGQSFVAGREVLGRIIQFLQSGEVGRRTAGGVVFDLRRDKLYLVRENRNIAPLCLPAGGQGVWDGRFDAVNGNDVPVRIAAGHDGRALGLFDEIPKGVVQRMRASAPVVEFQGKSGSGSAPKSVLSPRLAPFDRFLTRFDYNFADQIALAFGRMPYLSPPL